MGVPPESLSRAISDNGNPTLSTLEKIAAALGVEVVDLFDANRGDFTALVDNGGTLYRFDSIDALKGFVLAKVTKRQPEISANIKTKIYTLKDKYSQATSAEEFDAIGDELLKLCDEIENREQF